LQGADLAAPIAQAGVFYFGEELLAFFKDLRKAFATPPPYLRRAHKRSQDFWNRRVPPPSAGRLTIPELLAGLRVSVHASDCGVQHHVAASWDPGEIHIRLEDAKCAQAQCNVGARS
jgi:hypothetical protein